MIKSYERALSRVMIRSFMDPSLYIEGAYLI